MTTSLTNLQSLEDLDSFLASAGTDPVLLYKHSLTCGTSGLAFEEIQDLAASRPAALRIGVVRVQPAREVSTEIARRYGVRHESPQVLLMQNGRVLWHASHFRVTADGITDALNRLATGVGP